MAQFDIKFVVYVGRVNLSARHFFIREFVVAAETELNHSNELSLLFEGKVAILKDFTLAEWDSHKGLVLRREEEIVADVLKLQVSCAP